MGTAIISTNPVTPLEEKNNKNSLINNFISHDLDLKTNNLFVTKAKDTEKIQLNILDIKTEKLQKFTHKVYVIQLTAVVKTPKIIYEIISFVLFFIYLTLLF